MLYPDPHSLGGNGDGAGRWGPWRLALGNTGEGGYVPLKTQVAEFRS